MLIEFDTNSFINTNNISVIRPCIDYSNSHSYVSINGVNHTLSYLEEVPLIDSVGVARANYYMTNAIVLVIIELTTPQGRNALGYTDENYVMPVTEFTKMVSDKLNNIIKTMEEVDK